VRHRKLTTIQTKEEIFEEAQKKLKKGRGKDLTLLEMRICFECRHLEPTKTKGEKR